MIEIELVMPDHSFGEGDTCSLELAVYNPGATRLVDLYVLLDFLGDYWSYPSWQPISIGLDYAAVTVPSGESTLVLIPGFVLPDVSPAGPFYFYAAMFELGTLSPDTLASNGAVREFWLD